LTWRRLAQAFPIWLGVLATTLFGLLAYWSLDQLIEVVEVEGSSMWPTLTEHDVIVALRHSSLRSIKRGQIVIVRRESSSTIMVKRIVAVPGDYIRVCDDAVILNGMRIGEAHPTRRARGRLKDCTYQLASEQYFVLGDNRPTAIDSRDFGPIKTQEIRATMLVGFRPSGGQLATARGLCLGTQPNDCRPGRGC
jgi:signal peptidase I